MEQYNDFVVTDLNLWRRAAREFVFLFYDVMPNQGERNNFKQLFPQLPNEQKFVDKAYWDSLSWNPLPGWSYMDPNAGAKPTWDQAVVAYKTAVVGFGRAPGGDADYHIAAHRLNVAHESHEINDALIHVGQGLTQMPGLIHLLDEAGNAGEEMPLVVMRERDDGTPRTLHLQRQSRELVTGMAYQRNLVESAHNAIIAPFLEKNAQFNDRSIAAEIRYDIAAELDAFGKAYPAKLAAEMARLESADTLPEDIDELLEKYSERLEAA